MFSRSLRALGRRSHEARPQAGRTHLRRVRLVHRCSARSTLRSSQKACQVWKAAAWPRCVRKAVALRRAAAFQTWYRHSAKARPTTLQGKEPFKPSRLDSRYNAKPCLRLPGQLRRVRARQDHWCVQAA